MATARFRIGNQTAHHAHPVLAPYEFALASGFDSFEWFSDKESRAGWGEEDMDAEARRQVRMAGRARGIRFSVHAPHWAGPFVEEERQFLVRSIDFARDIGAEVVNIHLFPERGVAEFAAALAPILEHARRAGLTLAIENTPACTPEDFNTLFAIFHDMPEARQTRVGMCLDNGHANLCSRTRNDYLGYVDRLGSHVPIVHWHAHENWGDRDSHLPLFTGPSAHNDAGPRGLVQRLTERGFDGNVVLEQWPNPPGVLIQTRDRLRELMLSQGAG